MNTLSNRSAAAMMTSASVLVLASLAPVAHAQQTDVGAPGRALTTGTISTTSGNINDNGADSGVVVITGSNPVVLVTGATVNTLATPNRAALDVAGIMGSTGPLTVTFAGASTLQASGSALQAFSGDQALIVDTGNGNTFSAAGGPAINVGSQGGDLTVTNGANTVTSATNVALVTSTQGVGAGLVVNSTGGALDGLFGGIQANTGGGSVVIGQGSGITSAITGGPNGNGINSNTNGAGSIAIRTGAGGTINGVNTGINANSNGGAAVVVNVGGAIGQASAPVTGVRANSAGGSVAVNVSAALNATAAGVSATSSGAGAVTVTSTSGSSIVSGQRAVTATTSGVGAIVIDLAGATTGGVYAVSSGSGSTTINTAAVSAAPGVSGIDSRNIGLGSASIGSANQRVGPISGGTNGVFVTSGGDISVYADQVTGGTRGIVASNQTSNGNFTVNGATLVDVTGLVTASNGAGLVANNNGALAANTTTVRAANIVSNGGSAVSTFSNGGDTTITTGALTANFGNGTGWTGAFGQSNASIDLTVNGAINASFRGIDLESEAVGAGGALTINAGSAINGFQGIRAVTTGSGSIDIGQTTRTGAITTTNGAGVFASGAGDISIATGAVASVGGTAASVANGSATGVTADSGFGVAALSSGGSVNINADGLVTGGAAGGVLAQTTAPTGGVTINTAGVTAAAGRGIGVTTVDGPISVTTTSPIQAASFGIQATSAGSGAVTILASGPVTSTSANGIAVTNTGLGSVTVGTATDRTGTVDASGATGTGITAFGAGDVSVYATSVTGGTRGIVAANQYANPNGRVIIDVTGPVVGLNSWGIIGVNNGAISANSLSITTGDVTGTGRTAISAQTVGGDIAIVTNGVILSTASSTLTSNSAIFAESETDGLITIDALGSVDGYDGIYVLSDGTAGGVDIFAAGPVTGTNQYGVYARSGGGNILIEAQGPVSGAIGGVVGTAAGAGGVIINAAAVTASAGHGIQADASGGAVTINATGAITTRTTGISASNTSGAVAITTSAGGDIAPGAAIGIQASTTTGAITINQAGDIGAPGAGNTVGTGIDARIASGTADLTIASTGGIYVSPGEGQQSAGIYAVNGGTGAVNVTSTGIIDPGAYGVVIQGAGNVSYAANGGLVEGGQGAYVASTGGGMVNVTSTGGTLITGLTGIGLQTVGSGGAVNVSTAGAISGATSGLVASNTGTGATTVVITGAVTGQTGDGVNVSGDAGVITVTAAGPVTGANSGIVATSTGAGSTVVTNTGAVTSSGGPAINARSGTGGLTLDIRGDVISATGPAILATSAGGGTINVASGVVVAGRVDTATDSVILLNTASGSTSTVNVAQGATVQAVSGSPFTTAIRATGGSVVVNNAGSINGQIDFSALTGNDTGQLTGGVGTTFQTGGLSVFSAGDDTFTNAGQFVTVGSSATFAFRGGVNVFNNTGTMFVGFSPVAATGSTFVLSDLTTFNNAGTLNLMNGVLGDSIVASGSTYVGSGGARLLVDTAIGAPGGRSDVLTVGSSSGRTSVVIRDTAPTTFGAYNPTGTVIVNGDTHAGDFVLDSSSSFFNAGLFGGAIDKPGLFFGQLGVNQTGATVLVSLPKVQAYQFSTLASQAQAVWYETAPRAARQAEVRDQLASGTGVGGFWVEIQGVHATREVDRNAVSLLGVQSYDASYGQDIAGATIGYDAVRPALDGSVVFGASVGYVDSSADFDKQSTSVDMNGISASAYAGFVRGGWFAAATVGANQLSAEIDAPRLTGFTQQDTDISTLGGTIEAGFRAPFLMGTTIEPSVALAYVNSSVDNFSAAGATFEYEDGESLRPSLGARISGPLDILGDSWKTGFNVSVRGVGELMSQNDLVIAGTGPDLTVHDQFEDVYGEIKAGLTSESTNGWSVFGDVTGRYGDEYRAVGVSIGMRLRY